MSKFLMGTKACLGVLLCISIYTASLNCNNGHNEIPVQPRGWAKPLKKHCELSKIHCCQSENTPVFLRAWRASVRFLWVTAQNQVEHRAHNPNNYLSCMWVFLFVFFFASVNSRIKTAGMNIQLVSLSNLPKLSQPHPPPCLLQLPPFFKLPYSPFALFYLAI